MLFYSEIEVVFVNRLFDEELFECVHSSSENIVTLSQQDIRIEKVSCKSENQKKYVGAYFLLFHVPYLIRKINSLRGIVEV